MGDRPPEVSFEVLGPFVARDRQGRSLDLRGPRHRTVIARVLVARGEVIPVGRLVADLWLEPPAGAVGAIQTFVGALRRALEPERPPRAPARILATEPAGYRVCVAEDAVDAWRFERSVAAASELAPQARIAVLDQALALWRGPAYLELPDDDWARIEASRLAELRLLAAERRAEARIAVGAANQAVVELDAHVAQHHGAKTRGGF